MIDSIVTKIEGKFKVPERVADQLRIVAKRIGSSYILYESRPVWDDNTKPWTKFEVAKMTFIKLPGLWRVYWKRASGKWELHSEYKTLTGVLNAIKKNADGCFWG